MLLIALHRALDIKGKLDENEERMLANNKAEI